MNIGVEDESYHIFMWQRNQIQFLRARESNEVDKINIKKIQKVMKKLVKVAMIKLIEKLIKKQNLKKKIAVDIIKAIIINFIILFK